MANKFKVHTNCKASVPFFIFLDFNNAEVNDFILPEDNNENVYVEPYKILYSYSSNTQECNGLYCLGTFSGH